MSRDPSQSAFERAIAAFDAYHRKDPNTEPHNGGTVAKELLYAERMTARLASFAGNAEESVKLAARCQHIGRWEIPREQYTMDRKGYLQWRNDEKKHHARIAGQILSDCGYDPQIIEKVTFLLLKKELYSNPDTQILEDVACLVFLEFYAEEFASRHSDEKMIDILKKTLKKMSAKAKQSVGEIEFSGRMRSLIDQTSS